MITEVMRMTVGLIDGDGTVFSQYV